MGMGVGIRLMAGMLMVVTSVIPRVLMVLSISFMAVTVFMVMGMAVLVAMGVGFAVMGMGVFMFMVMIMIMGMSVFVEFDFHFFSPWSAVVCQTLHFRTSVLIKGPGLFYCVFIKNSVPFKVKNARIQA
jgi:hypothetical protein